MKDKREEIRIPERDETDARLADLFSRMRESYDSRTESTREEFVGRVMKDIPRRDISMWVVMAFALMGVGATVICMGGDGVMMFLNNVFEFFNSLGSFKCPSVVSVVSLCGVLGMFFLICRALLYTEDYQEEF